jgi:flagellin-like protein
MCLIAGVIVQSGRTLCKASKLPKSAVSGVLAALLVVAMTFSVSHSLHRILHHDGAGSDHFCLACSIAKGHVGAAAVALMPTMLVLFGYRRICLATASPFSGFDYRTSPSRAPPLA